MNTSSTAAGTDATLSPLRGIAMYVGAVLGPGILTLPALAAQKAGPAFLVALVALLALSAALASTFAALGRHHPDDAGLVKPVTKAFGARWGRVVTALFYLGVPPGVAALGLFGGGYVQAVVGGAHTDVIVAAILICASWLLNRAGLRASASVQVVMTGLLLVIVFAAVVSAVPEVEAAHFTPVAPQGWSALAPAAFLLVWVLTGWEASANLAVALPTTSLRRVISSSVIVIAAAFLGLSVVLVGVLGSDNLGQAPVADLLVLTVGPAAGVVGVGLALVLTLGNMNAYVAALAALGRTIRGAQRAPGGPLTLPTAIALLSLVVARWSSHPETLLVGVTAASQVPVLGLAVASGVRLLPAGAARRAAIVATSGTTILLLSAGWYLVAPASITAVVLFVDRRTTSRRLAQESSTTEISSPDSTAAGRPRRHCELG